jgi:phospholipase D-like protein
MVFGGGLIGLALLALWLFAIFDVIATDSALCRNLPKMVWLILVIILPDVGAICWLLLGRPVNAGFRPGDSSYRAPRRPLGLEDSPTFVDRAAEVERSAELDRRLDEWEEQQRRREQELGSGDDTASDPEAPPPRG